MDIKRPPLWLLSGPIGAGKTTFCQQLAQAAPQYNLQVAGLLSLAQITAGQKTGILLENLRNGEQHPLAHTAPEPTADLRFGKWHFDSQVLAWGNQVLADGSPCDLLIVDELGPLEFNRREGLIAAFELLTAGQYQMACAVIRPSLLAAACLRWPWAQPVDVTGASTLNLLSRFQPRA